MLALCIRCGPDAPAAAPAFSGHLNGHVAAVGAGGASPFGATGEVLRPFHPARPENCMVVFSLLQGMGPEDVLG
jgi:hypothetical protein